MTRDRKVEAAVGLFVAAGLAALLMLAVRVGNLTLQSDAGSYRVTARFENIGGLRVRAPVSMSGIRIGQVVALGFDPETYDAIATLEIEGRYDRVPADSAASIFTAGLLGEQYVSISPGGGATLALVQTAGGSLYAGCDIFSRDYALPRSRNV